MSGQKDVDKHRVRLTHKVEESGSIQDVEIPFVMGVLTDAYGNHPDSKKTGIEEAEFTEITSHSFNKYLRDAKPRVLLNVQNHLSEVEGEELVADIEFSSMKHFTPDHIASSVSGLKEVYEIRQKLDGLLRHLESSRSAKKLVDDVLKEGGEYEELIKTLSEAADKEAEA